MWQAAAFDLSEQFRDKEIYLVCDGLPFTGEHLGTKQSPIQETSCIVDLGNFTIALAGLTGEVAILDSAEKVMQLEGHASAVRSLTLLENGKLASGSDDGTVKLWNAESGACEETLRLFEPDDHCIYNIVGLDGNKLAATYCSRVSVWDLERHCLDFDGHFNYVRSLVRIDKTPLVASACASGRICIWNSDTGELTTTIETERDVWELFDIEPRLIAMSFRLGRMIMSYYKVDGEFLSSQESEQHFQRVSATEAMRVGDSRITVLQLETGTATTHQCPEIPGFVNSVVALKHGITVAVSNDVLHFLK